MPTCSHCAAKLLPGQSVCKACGESVRESQPDGVDALLGTTIAGNFEVLELIGEGAMGRVYKARQISLDKLVAIKVLHRHLANDPKVVRRFHREARAASRLSHPNSLQIIDFGEDGRGTLYIAMELLDGDDLLTVIEEDAPLSPARIANIMKGVLSALDEAHHAGIIHRDLKPENVVILERRGGGDQVKVCDFGIAKIQEAEGGSAITMSGFVCGTPEFMAPEQARGEELDARADIYAAGCMLYQLLTGSVPFKADSALGIITKHLTEQVVPPRDRCPSWNIPTDLEAVCMKAMGKKREDRFPDAATMASAIAAAIAPLGEAANSPVGHGPPAPYQGTRTTTSEAAVAALPPTRTPMKRWFVASAVGVVLLVVAGMSLWPPTGPATSDPDGGAGRPSLQNRGGLPQVGAPTRESVADRPGNPDGDPAAAGLGPPESPAQGAESGAQDGIGPEPGESPGATAPGGGRPAATGSDPGPGATRRTPPLARPSHPVATTNPQPSGGGATSALSPGQQAYEEGRRRFLSNDVDGAITHFNEAARLMPQNADVHKQLGRAHMRAGQVEAARRAYRRYLDLAPQAVDRAIIERIIASDN